MKRLFNLIPMGIVALSMVFTSCDPTETEVMGPEITFKAGADLIVDDASIDAGTKASFSWEVNAGDANLESFVIRSSNVDWFVPEGNIDKDQYEDTFDTTLAAGTYTFTFIATDKDGEQAIKEITVTVNAALVTQGSETLGAGGSTLGSYYSVSEDAVYKLADAKTNAAKVDIVFTSTASVAKFIAPKDASASELQTANRATTYAKATFNFATATAGDIAGVTPTASELVVAKDDVVVFKTQDGVMGVLEVTALTVATDGSVTIDIKVKQ